MGFQNLSSKKSLNAWLISMMMIILVNITLNRNRNKNIIHYKIITITTRSAGTLKMYGHWLPNSGLNGDGWYV